MSYEMSRAEMKDNRNGMMRQNEWPDGGERDKTGEKELKKTTPRSRLPPCTDNDNDGSPFGHLSTIGEGASGYPAIRVPHFMDSSHDEPDDGGPHHRMKEGES